jgi:hypothetical protein
MKNFRTTKIGIFNAEQQDRSVLVQWAISSAASIRFMKLRSMPCNDDERIRRAATLNRPVFFLLLFETA